MLLEVNQLVKSFGGIRAVRDVTIAIPEGSICSIIGPNGAGKTTLFNLLTGIYKPDSGTIGFNGRSLIGLRPDQVNAAGVARTFQSIRLFGNMSVLENVMVGMHSRLDVSLRKTLLRTSGFAQQERHVREYSSELLQFVGLAGKGDELARNLPYGDQRRVEIARALASDPKLILLDEPTAGMSSEQVPALLDIIKKIRGLGTKTIVLVEHRMDMVMSISDRITVMHLGNVLAEGTPQEISNTQSVQDAYLGALYGDITKKKEA